MIQRQYWLQLLEQSWKKRPIIWLAGVRRSGKTTLAKAIASSEYYNCDDPDVQEKLKDPMAFLRKIKAEKVIFDEVHQLDNASQILKLAHDEFGRLKVLATGSSTLVASKKFKDTLTGRKSNVHFVPILPAEVESFGVTLNDRIIRGGLPQALLSDAQDREFYSEWLDSFFARDIQELFAIEKRQPFLKVLELLLVQNGKQIELSEIGKVAGISRPTVVKYIEALEVTKAITVVRPFYSNTLSEIVSQPKIYGFDTGFVCFAQGDTNPGSTEQGYLLENLALEIMQACQIQYEIKYWREKKGTEVDFVIPISKNNQLAIECKSKSKHFDSKNLSIFRKLYPHGENWVVTLDSTDGRGSFTKRIDNLQVEFMGILDFFERCQAAFT